MAWHTLPDLVGPSPAAGFNLGAYASQDEGEPSPTLFRGLLVVAAGTTAARIGSSVSSTKGLPVPAASGGGAPVLVPYVGENCLNNLGSMNVFVPSGTTVSIMYEY